MMDLESSLKRHFGFRSFRPGQEQVIRAITNGESALALFPTGAGKSICYQLPALLRQGTALVISPLIALMKDQVEALRKRKIAAARLDSTLTADEVRQVLADLRGGRIKLLYVAPERLVSESFISHLENVPLSLMAIDEAHCISEWGHNFRPEYLRLAMMARRLRIHPVLALTATATPAVADDICRAFDILPHNRVVTSFHRPNLYLKVTPTPASKRLPLLKKRLEKPRSLPAIVYTTLQETAEHVATALGNHGIRARAYHAGMADEYRAEAQEAFMTGQCDVMVATIAFGMGIDKANIRAVFHYNLPKTLENYQQETGRAGRDGKTALCEMLACGDDRTVLENFIHGDTPTETSLRQIVDFLLRQGPEFEISKYEMAWANDVRPLVLETVVTLLELDGILEPTHRYWENWQIHFPRGQAACLSGRDPAEQELCQQIFATGTSGYKWLKIPISTAATETGLDRRQITTLLGDLEATGEISIKRSGLRECYRLLEGARSINTGELAAKLHQTFAAREKRDAQRLEEVVALAEGTGCLTKRLLARFGETLPADCGHCEACRRPSDTPQPLPSSNRRTITVADIAIMQDLIQQRHPALRNPRQIARFLCGISSPAAARDKLTRWDTFSTLADVPFQDVLLQLQSLIR